MPLTDPEFIKTIAAKDLVFFADHHRNDLSLSRVSEDFPSNICTVSIKSLYVAVKIVKMLTNVNP
jgi:hypothetical protein